MHLLNLTLSPPTSITAAAVGSYSGTKGQEILVVRGSTKLELLKLNSTTGQCELDHLVSSAIADLVVDTICSTEVRLYMDAIIMLTATGFRCHQEYRTIPFGGNDQG